MMTIPVVGIIASSITLVALVSLFRFEERRGVRVLASVREQLDAACMRIGASFERISGFVQRDIVRQSILYLFHVILMLILRLVRWVERNVHEIQRINKAHAHRMRQERTQRSIFDEIADHKASLSLTKEERRKKKHAMLEKGHDVYR